MQEEDDYDTILEEDESMQKSIDINHISVSDVDLDRPAGFNSDEKSQVGDKNLRVDRETI